jgi:hypothetical protein
MPDMAVDHILHLVAFIAITIFDVAIFLSFVRDREPAVSPQGRRSAPIAKDGRLRRGTGELSGDKGHGHEGLVQNYTAAGCRF